MIIKKYTESSYGQNTHAIYIGRFRLVYWNGAGYVRLGNWYGVHFKNLKKQSMTFSERNGYVKRITLFNWSFKILKPI